MILRWENKLFSFYIGVNRIEYVDGYNSRLPEGRHFLMWDFDDTPLEDVKAALVSVQRRYILPRIWILNTGRPDCYHANCFINLSWESVRAIIGATQFVDKKYLAIGILREFFTLRYAPAGGREFSKAIIIPSPVRENVNPFCLTSFATYPKKRR